LKKSAKKMERLSCGRKEEAARIQPLQHGHHRTAKQPKLELPSVVKAVPKSEKTRGSRSRKATHRAKNGEEEPQGGVSLRRTEHDGLYGLLLLPVTSS
jgi:hypothetical protein